MQIDHKPQDQGVRDIGMIELHTLGTLDLRDAGGHSCRYLLARPKRMAVLLYLAVATPRGLHRRDTLVGLFWPELDQEKARHALRQAVHHLRHALGANVIVGRGDEGVGVDPAVLWCDAAAFEAALDAGQPSNALEMFRGDLAPDLESMRDMLRVAAKKAAAGLGAASPGAAPAPVPATGPTTVTMPLEHQDPRGAPPHSHLIGRGRAAWLSEPLAERLHSDGCAEPFAGASRMHRYGCLHVGLVAQHLRAFERAMIGDPGRCLDVVANRDIRAVRRERDSPTATGRTVRE